MILVLFQFSLFKTGGFHFSCEKRHCQISHLSIPFLSRVILHLTRAPCKKNQNLLCNTTQQLSSKKRRFNNFSSTLLDKDSIELKVLVPINSNVKQAFDCGGDHQLIVKIYVDGLTNLWGRV